MYRQGTVGTTDDVSLEPPIPSPCGYFCFGFDHLYSQSRSCESNDLFVHTLCTHYRSTTTFFTLCLPTVLLFLPTSTKTGSIPDQMTSDPLKCCCLYCFQTSCLSSLKCSYIVLSLTSGLATVNLRRRNLLQIKFIA